MLVSLTVGKVDAGVAVLLTQDKRLVSYTDHPWIFLLTIRTDRISFYPVAFHHHIWVDRRHRGQPEP